MRTTKRILVLLLACLTGGILTSHNTPVSIGENLGDSGANVFFDMTGVKLYVKPKAFPANLTFVEIAEEMVQAYSPSTYSSQLIFTHRNIPSSYESIGSEVTPAALGLEGYKNYLNQPGGLIRVTVGYRVSLLLDKREVIAFLLDLDEEVGSWVKRTLNTYNEIGILYVNSNIISSLDNLRKAFEGLIDDVNKTISGDIVIRISEECQIVNTNGLILNTRVSQKDTLESLLTKLDWAFPESDLLNNKVLCLNPSCQNKLTNLTATFSTYNLEDYKTLYIPGLLVVRLKVGSSEESTNLLLERSLTVDEFVIKIRESLFNKNPSIHIAIHSVNAPESIIIDSLKIEDNKATLFADLRAHSFKVIAEEPEDCIVEIKTTLPNIVSEDFKGSFPCSTNLREILIPVHRYFSKPYSYRLYENNEQILNNPPGLIIPKFIPQDSKSSDLAFLPIQTFRETKGARIIFDYSYQIVVRAEYTNSPTPANSEIHFSVFPLNTPTNEIYRWLAEFRNHSSSLLPIPLTSSSSSAISLSNYYASAEDIASYAGPLLSLYTPGYPALYYQVYKASSNTEQRVVFMGEYNKRVIEYCPLTPQLTKRDFEMVIRRWLVKDAGKAWEAGEEDLLLMNAALNGVPLEWKLGETWKDVLNRLGANSGQMLEIEVRKRNQDSKTERLGAWLKINRND